MHRSMSDHLSEDLILDGYRLVRFLGRGGFGEVWLCRSESMGDYRALKFIPTTHSDRFEKEYEALVHYRKAAALLRSPHLVPIEHVNRNEAGLYYVMPLADGTGAADPTDPAWQPTSVATLVHERSKMVAWFSSQEIIGLLLPVLEALQTLSDAGLVHRDVKPENILLFHGQPCLGDISLLGSDDAVITRRGTPGYGTPSWYVGGHPDMYGVAATLFTLLTGNLPDRMGRAAFIWPPQGEASLSADEQAKWKRLHAVIRRATEENVAERFVDFRTMARALRTGSTDSDLPDTPASEQTPGHGLKGKPKAKRRRTSRIMIFVGVFLLASWLIGVLLSPPPGRNPAGPQTEETPSAPPDNKPSDATSAPPIAKGFKIVDAGGRFESMREKITGQLGVIMSPRSSGTTAPKRLDPTAYSKSSAVFRSYKARDYAGCLDAIDALHAARGVSKPEPEAVLFRCMLLTKLGRSGEAEPALLELSRRPVERVADPADFMLRLSARLDLWEALGGHAAAVKLVTETLSQVQEDAAKWPAGTLEQLYHQRARALILAGDFAGALADEQSAIGLPLPLTNVGTTAKALDQTEAQARQAHLNTMVMQWELLEQEFPDYAGYLTSIGSPEPKLDRRDLRDVD